MFNRSPAFAYHSLALSRRGTPWRRLQNELCNGVQQRNTLCEISKLANYKRHVCHELSIDAVFPDRLREIDFCFERYIAPGNEAGKTADETPTKSTVRLGGLCALEKSDEISSQLSHRISRQRSLLPACDETLPPLSARFTLISNVSHLRELDDGGFTDLSSPGIYE